MEDYTRLVPRQIWAQPSSAVYLNRTYALTLTENAIFEPACTSSPTVTSHASPMLDTRDPFYASVTPQLYAIGCATIVSYLLVIILLITPRTFYVGGPGGGANFLGRHGMISGSYSDNSSVVGVGGRPWLQKVAAILVAISLTIATADSFRVAEDQYIHGYSDAEALAEEVIDGVEIRVVRVISSTFLWLAQVQTLIRLFPRHKEKIMIKWAGFALIVLDTIFSILDKFLVQTNTTRPRLYDDAIPALSYLFELALNLLYAAWVIFYSLSKHKFAFFHPKMRNICLVALLSLCAILIPVVFFVLDIAKPEIAGWGTYVRWVGSAAASVVVWEWVERIEALERDERKDGILGREIFDGDEMLEVTPSEEVDWPRQNNTGNDRGGGTGVSSGWGGMMGLGHRPLRTRVGLPNGNRTWQSRPEAQNRNSSIDPRRRRAARPTPPPAAATPVSRADTTSAASTVYNVHYHPVSSPTPPVVMPHMEEEGELSDEAVAAKELATSMEEQQTNTAHDGSEMQNREHSPQIVADHRWRTVLNPFKRRRASLPREVASAQAEDQIPNEEEENLHEGQSGARRGSQVSTTLLPFSRRTRPGSGRQGSDTPLPVTVIPARHRGQQTWSPQWFNNSSILEPSPRRHNTTVRPNLPVRVIQPQTRTAAPWTTSEGEGDFGNGNYELRYDPEAAALIGFDGPSNEPPPASQALHETERASFTDELANELGERSISVRQQEESNQEPSNRYPVDQSYPPTASHPSQYHNGSTDASEGSRPPQ
ncbi:PalH/RIM21 family protein [Aspergillus tanneri]|uniref:pH-response regulator protein palH/rim21 n=1 Tax=Aspergillus tanneri TaxID=1220188 RepID=A0A5M9MGW8_9EURO|nr:pH-response regulator protein palH/rim21 [Aspergillus tanneri]KAA8643729.1 pH-response regulator protein palH/rim21 [Aspergillus tanneri]